MNILFGVLTLLFGLVHGIAAFVQTRQPNHPASAHLMLAGAATLLWSGIQSLRSVSGDFVLGFLGCFMIIAAAILNGRQKAFHLLHHIVRIFISVVIVVALFLS